MRRTPKKKTSKGDQETLQDVMNTKTQGQGTINPTLNSIIVKSLAITHPNVELLTIIELKRRKATLKKQVQECDTLLMAHMNHGWSNKMKTIMNCLMKTYPIELRAKKMCQR